MICVIFYDFVLLNWGWRWQTATQNNTVEYKSLYNILNDSIQQNNENCFNCMSSVTQQQSRGKHS